MIRRQRALEDANGFMADRALEAELAEEIRSRDEEHKTANRLAHVLREAEAERDALKARVAELEA